MIFTQDFFSQNIENFERCNGLLNKRDRILEIGSFEGRSACWILQNMLDPAGTLDCIDTFDDRFEFSQSENMLKTFSSNVCEVIGPHQKWKTYSMNSEIALSQFRAMAPMPQYDFVYIDGDHSEGGVYADAVDSWPLVAIGGIVLFDDFLYVHPTEKTRLGIEKFLGETQCEVLFQNYQLAVRKGA